MLFAVLGKIHDISLAEIELLKPTFLEKGNKGIVFFETEDEQAVAKLGGITKYGRLVEQNNPEFIELLNETKLLGTNDKTFGLKLKKEFKIKRFVEIELGKSNLDVKTNGVEIVKFSDRGEIGVVIGYQNIPLYQEVDFEKPVSGMKVGMMPSKLAHTMLNIGLANYSGDKNIEDVTIYDPFVGFGTTGFLANSMGHNFIASDLNITSCKKNLKWWSNNELSTDKLFTTFKHDVTDEFTKPFLKNVDLIVSEGWLGPVVKQNLGDMEAVENWKKILNIYEGFLKNVNSFWDKITVVITIPVYEKKGNYVGDTLTDLATELGFEVKAIEQLYKRKNQFVARQVIVFKK